MHLLALGWLIKGFENIGIVNFRKNMRFDKEFYFLFGRKLVSFAVAIPVALIWRNYWALVAGITMQHIASVAMSYALHPFRPRLSLHSAGLLYQFSKWILINNALLFLRHRSSDFIIGRILGVQTLGFYTVGYEISNMAMTELIAPMNRAIYPGLAKQSGNLEQLRQSFLDVIAVLWLLALPMAFGIVVTAKLLVPLFLGEQWLDIVPVIRILAISGGLNVVVGNITYVWIAQGKPRLVALFTAVRVACILPLLIILTQQYGMLGAAWAHLLGSIIALPFNYLMICATLKLQITSLLSKIWRPVIATAVMHTILTFFIKYQGRILPSWAVVDLIFTVVIGIILYSGCILLLWGMMSKPFGVEQITIDHIMIQWRRLVKRLITAND